MAGGLMTDKKNPFGNGYFENPPEVVAKDPPPSDPAPPKLLAMKGRTLTFAFDLLRVLNAYKIGERQGVPVPERFCNGLSPQKVASVVAFMVDLDLELFAKHDFYNANISTRTATLANLNGAFDDTEFEVKSLVETFLPEEFTPEAKARVFSLHMRIFSAIADGRIKPEDVAAGPGELDSHVLGKNPF